MRILVLETVEGAAGLEEVEEIDPVRVRMLPEVRVGAVEPLLLKTRPARVFAPNSVRVEAPLRVTVLR